MAENEKRVGIFFGQDLELDRKRSRRAFRFPPFRSPLARRCGDGALSQRQARHWPTYRYRFFLRIPPRRAFYSRRSRENRKKDARTRRAGLAERAQANSQARSLGALQKE